MDEDSQDSYEINSFYVNKVMRQTNGFGLTKKRKLQEHLNLPLSKHKFGIRSSSSEHEYPFPEEPEFSQMHLLKEKTVRGLAKNGSEQESTKDSNSFVGESDLDISPYTDTEFEIQAYTYDHHSTSSDSCSSKFIKNALPLDDKTIKEISFGKDEPIVMGKLNLPNLANGQQSESVSQSIDTEFPEFGKYVDYISPAFGDEGIQQYLDEEEDDDMLLYSNGATSNLFVLSSGRWSVNQEARLGAKKPTIDQEFEQYFSMLML
ncbi:PREDICTED: uncharacterized protein LOC104597154 [Nelumbo nucifera]|uniref:Uncharacterized protein LOC104597154 n=1 Tax=Nelumbo nucifera TaxID=4432 RepID=A0A1U7ZX75_NELNU|nr:PREDICTED: uncharacterized protein LOC104597154 [Nelumbo nucifera]